MTRVLLRIATSTPVRAAVTVGLLTGLAVWIDWGQVVDRLEQGRWELFVVGVLLVVVALATGALRWHLFLRAGGVDATLYQAFRAYWIGMFANNFLPTGFGGDVARAMVIRPAAPSTARAVASVVVDRLTALACLLVFAWLTLTVAPDDVPASLIGVLAIATAVGSLSVAAFSLFARRRGGLAARVLAQGTAVAGTRSVLGATTALGLLYQALMVLATWTLARAIDLDLSFTLIAVVTPLVIVATLMPISIAGFGVREGGYVVLLAQAGVSAADATLLSLLNVAALAIATLPGAAALLLPAATPRERAPAP
jgi:glycosyltransferase 2 family protein